MIAAEHVLTRAAKIKTAQARPRSVVGASRSTSRVRSLWKRALMVLSVLAVMAALLPGSAVARDMTGKGGLGLMQSSHPQMSRLPTLTFRYWGRRVCWELLLGFDVMRDRSQTAVYFKTAPATQVFMLDTDIEKIPDARNSVDRTTPWFFDTTHIFAGLGVHRMVYEGSNLSVTLGVRGVAQVSSMESKARSFTSQGQLTSALALLAEVPFQAEYFLSDHSSVSASVSLSASISSSLETTNATDGGLGDLLGASDANRGGMTIEFGGRYSGGVGYTYYF